MVFLGKRGPHAASARRRRGAIRLGGELLEGRQLMAIDLANVATAPYGVQQVGAVAGLGAGYSVTDVGNVTGSGYDSFLVSAPTVTLSSTGPTVASGSGSTVYLIFGSQQVNAQTIDFALLSAQQRIGSLGQLGNATQTNPFNGQSGLSFNGLIFTTSLNPASNLGASVVPLGNLTGNGISSFMIGAPGALNSVGLASGTGRAYIIYGSAALATTGFKTVDLDTPSTYPTNIVTLVSNSSGAKVGSSGAALGNFLNNNVDDIAIGAPGFAANTGEVFVISGGALSTPQTGVINLDRVGQTGGVAGVTFTGANIGDQFGYSVASAGDVNGATNAFNINIPIYDMVVGAPQTGSGGGEAYLLYGGTNFARFSTTVGGLISVNVAQLANTGTGTTTTANSTTLPGAIFTGGAASLTGYSVASAGSFSGTGFGSFMIGAPNAFNLSGFNGLGAVYMIQGAGLLGSPTGTIDLTNIPASLPSVTFVGQTANSLTGYSETAMASANSNAIDDIAIGAPGYNNEQGSVYVIPGNSDLGGVYPLGASQLFGQQIIVSNSATPAYLGTSVSGRIVTPFQPIQTHTADGDLLGDLIIGAPGYTLPTTSSGSVSNAGSAFIVLGKFLGLPTPVSVAITTQIGVGAPFGPFSLNATTPPALSIYVFSNSSKNFAPVADINPATITVNGVAYPNAKITAAPIDYNGDGILDAIITITPRSALQLVNGAVTITFHARTTAAAGNLPVVGTATALVTGSNNTGGGGGGGVFNGGGGAPVQAIPTEFIPPLGSALVPPVASLSTFDSYQPLPYSVAYAQFLPKAGWLLRMEIFSGRLKRSDPSLQRHYFTLPGHNSSGVYTLNNYVFTRDKYHPGKSIRFNHHIRVIPFDRQRHQVYSYPV